MLYGLLWPFRIVNQWEQGVRTRWGHVQRPSLTHENGLFGSGLQVFWPIIGDLQTHESNLEVSETDLQTVRLTSGEEITFSFGAQTRVRDWALLYSKVQDPDASIAEAIRGAGATVARQCETLDEFAGKVEDDTVLAEAKKQMHGWGVDVMRIRSINLTAATPFRLIIDSLVGSSGEEA